MCTDTDSAAVIEYHDLICGMNAGGTLGYDKYGRICIHFPDSLTQSGIRCIVKRRSTVVEDQDIRLSDQRPGDRQTLSLSTGEIASALLYRLIKAERLGFHNIQRLGCF